MAQLASQPPLLKMEWNAKTFTICYRDDTGRSLFLYPPDDNVATCVIRCINLCREMLENQTVRDAFTNLAENFSKTHPNAWYLRELIPEDKGNLKLVTTVFLQEVLHRFPVVFVDDTFRSSNTMAAHFRHPWSGGFRTSDQAILFNARRLRHMLAAAIIANGSPDADVKKDYQAFLFMGANTFLHEISHVFLTYLTQGQENTPPTMMARIAGVDVTKGEAGRKLEEVLFGGIVDYAVDPDTGTADESCGTPYLADADGVYRILPETISKTVKGDFEFPYRHEGIKESRLLMAMDNLPDDVITDPIDHPMWGQPLGPPPARP